MKRLNKHLLPSIAFFATLIAGSVNADTNGLVFPPANALSNMTSNMGKANVYPPQMPSQPMLNRMPQAPTYKFNRANPQQRFPANNRRAMPGYGQNPQRAMPRNMPRQAYSRQNRQYPSYPNPQRNNNSFPFSNNMMPFGNSGNNNVFPFSNGNMPFGNNGNSFGMPSNPMNNRNGNMPFFSQNNNKRKKAWGTERNIWPDFYTDFTDEAWDTVMGGPRDLGTMPGGWRFPYISTPDPVTVSDAIVNQFPPIAEEAGNMADFSDWGVFDNK